jgi:hypothetical protein
MNSGQPPSAEIRIQNGAQHVLSLTLPLPAGKPPYGTLLDRPVGFGTSKQQCGGSPESRLMADDQYRAALVGPAGNGEHIARCSADPESGLDFVGQFQGIGCLLRAFGGLTRTVAFAASACAASVRPASPAFRRARSGAALIGGGAVSFFGFGVTPEYQFHSSLLSGKVKAKSSV